MWRNVDLSRSRPIEEMQVWDGLSAARITFEAPYSATEDSDTALFPTVEPMATLVENLNLQRALLKSLRHEQARGDVEIMDGVKVLGIAEGEGGWPVVTVSGKDGAPARQLRARLLVSSPSLSVVNLQLTLSNVRRLGQMGTTLLCAATRKLRHLAGHTMPMESSLVSEWLKRIREMV